MGPVRPLMYRYKSAKDTQNGLDGGRGVGNNNRYSNYLLVRTAKFPISAGIVPSRSASFSFKAANREQEEGIS
jgi:hypothetical protein